jgi:outer membrane immunogenic protein
MRRHIGWALASVISLGIGGVGAASAADMAVKARPVVVPPPVFTWTGCYLGGNVGYARADDWSDATPNAAFIANAGGGAAQALGVAASATNRRTPGGVTVGGGFGCNYQTGMFVFGGEGDINYTDLHRRTLRTFPGVAPYTWEDQFRSN